MPATLRIALLLLDEPLSTFWWSGAAQFDAVPKKRFCSDECRICKFSTLRITAPMTFLRTLALLLVTYLPLAQGLRRTDLSARALDAQTL